MQLRNRMVVTSMGAGLAEDDGTVGERLIAFHEEQAKGGVGMIISGVAGVAWPVGSVQPNQIAISDDRYIPGLKALSEKIHAHGAKFAIQLHQGGLVAGYSLLKGWPLWCPSIPIADPDAQLISDAFVESELQKFGPTPKVTLKEMSKEDIRTVVEQFRAGADRAKRADADGVEIAAGHGYLLSSFISPKFNRRTDEYGGPLENRVRFLLEIIAAVRSAVGTDFPVWVKLDSQQFGAPDGIQLEHAIKTAQLVEAAGADAITASSYHHIGKLKLHSESYVPFIPGWNLPAAEAIKRSISIPVIASGRVELDVGETKIAASAFDFLAMGRKLLADPYLPKKVMEGKLSSIRPCIYCYTCISGIYLRDSVRCAVNSDLAFEYRRSNTCSEPRRYVVVGGGPGGMEAARRLDEQGHKVTLLERSPRLGGTLQFAGLAYEPNERLLNWMRQSMAESGVDVRLNTDATPELVASLKPDAVLVATGALRTMPSIPGSELPHVFSGDDLRSLVLGQSSSKLAHKVSVPSRLVTRLAAATGLTSNLTTLRKASHWWMPLGKRIVIVGGSLVGLELAEFLMERGRIVTVVDDEPRFGTGLMLVRRMRLLEELKEHGVALFPGAKDIGIGTDAVRFIDKNGVAQTIGANNVVVAKGATANPTVADSLRQAGFKVHAFGDCTGVGYIEGAIRGAADVITELTQTSAARDNAVL